MKTAERAFVVSDLCPKCESGRMRVCRRRADRAPFIGCDRFPYCRHVEAYDHFMQQLLSQLQHLQTSSYASPPVVNLSAIDAKLRELIFRCHPDRNRDGVDGTQVVTALNELRASLKRAA